MVEEKKELPQVEEPKAAEAKKEVDVDGLMSALEAAGVTNPEDLEGKLRAGSEVGRVAQLLGDERKRTSELETRLRELESRPAPRQRDDWDLPQEGQTVDIESAIERSVDKVFTKREQAQRQAQEAQIKAWNQIQSDEDYGLVKDVWEEKLKDPNFVYKIQSGMINPVDEYTKTLRQFYKGLLKQSHETITTLRGGPKEPPHVETGERTPNLVSEDKDTTAERQFLDKMGEKVRKGYVPTEEEEALIAEATLVAGLGN